MDVRAPLQPRGILLHGPPGCGKTLLANAIAGELDVAFLRISAPEIVSGMSGESEQKVQGDGMVPLPFQFRSTSTYHGFRSVCTKSGWKKFFGCFALKLGKHYINVRHREAFSKSHGRLFTRIPRTACEVDFD